MNLLNLIKIDATFFCSNAFEFVDNIRNYYS